MSVLILVLPFIDVLTEVGLASAYPQLYDRYESTLRASTVIAAGPLAAVLSGWLWGLITRRYGIRFALYAAVLGWSGAVVAMALTLDSFAPMVAARVVHGAFAAGFAAVPFIAVTALSSDHGMRTHKMSRIEIAASVGAISGPLMVGSGIVLAPRFTLLTVAAVPAVFILLHLLVIEPHELTGDRAPAESSPSDANAQTRMKAGFSLRILLPVAYASLVALVLSAFESLVPTVTEMLTGAPLLGKTLTVAFEITVVLGIAVKARHPGVRRMLPVSVAAGLALSLIVADLPVVLLTCLVVLGFGIGAQVTMGNELAAQTVRSSGEHGMGIYSTLRITGSFMGPLFLSIPFPAVLGALMAVSVLGVLPIQVATRTYPFVRCGPTILEAGGHGRESRRTKNTFPG